MIGSKWIPHDQGVAGMGRLEVDRQEKWLHVISTWITWNAWNREFHLANLADALHFGHGAPGILTTGPVAILHTYVFYRHFLQACPFFLGEGPNDFGWIAHQQVSCRELLSFGYQAAGCNQALVPDFGSIHYDGSHSDKTTIPDAAGMDDAGMSHGD